MSQKLQSTISSTATRQPITRRRLKQYTAGTYGARLPYADARFMDDFCEQNKMERADAVRLAIKQFVARQQLKYQRKDPAREMQEQILREQLSPVLEQLQTLSNAIQEADNRPAKKAKSATPDAENKLLEQNLMTASLALRILINYALEPTLRVLETTDATKIQPHLQAAAEGQSHWCESTRKVIGLTQHRVFRELNMEISKTLLDAAEQNLKAFSEDGLTELNDAEIEAILSNASGDNRV